MFYTGYPQQDIYFTKEKVLVPSAKQIFRYAKSIRDYQLSSTIQRLSNEYHRLCITIVSQTMNEKHGCLKQVNIQLSPISSAANTTY